MNEQITEKRSQKPPHILFIMSDEHRFDYLGYGGNRIVKTPHLDRLAEKAVVFDNAYTPSPICCPARQSIAAGKFPNNCGCDGWKDLSPEYPTFARAFSEDIYSTVAAGKLHHFEMDKMQGWQERLNGDFRHAYQNQASEERKALFPDREQTAGNFDGGTKWADRKEIEKSGEGLSRGARMDLDSTRMLCEHIGYYFGDDYFEKNNPAQPGLFYLGLIAPHYPYAAKAERIEYYLDKIEFFENEEPFEHPFLGRSAFYEGKLQRGKDIPETDVRRAMAAYCALIEEMDSQIGEVLQAIEAAGQDLDDWVILYTSDHGEMLGEHGIWEKQKFFEGSVRVPLFIHAPKRFSPKAVAQNVNLCDLYSTFCDLAGIAIPEGLDSRSLVPLMEGRAEDWDNESVSQFFRTPSPVNATHVTACMIKRDDLKYQYYNEEMPEVLFDLKVNPGETVNYAEDPAYAEVMAEFRKRRFELGFGIEEKV